MMTNNDLNLIAHKEIFVLDNAANLTCGSKSGRTEHGQGPWSKNFIPPQ